MRALLSTVPGGFTWSQPFRPSPSRAAPRASSPARSRLSRSRPATASWTSTAGSSVSTVANGVVRDPAGATLATVQVDLSENVGPALMRLSAGVMGPANSAGAPLKGRVTAARLETESGELIAAIPTGTSTLYVDAVVALNMELPSRQEYARVRGALLTAQREGHPRDRPARARPHRDDTRRRKRPPRQREAVQVQLKGLAPVGESVDGELVELN